MSIQSDLDQGALELLGQGSTDELTARIITAGGSQDVTVVFEEPTSIPLVGEAMVMTQPTASLRSCDLPTNANANKSVLWLGRRSFELLKIEPDSLGWTKLTLREKK